MNDWTLLIFCGGMVISGIVGFGILLAHREARLLHTLRREMLDDLKRTEEQFIAEQKVRLIIGSPREKSKLSTM